MDQQHIDAWVQFNAMDKCATTGGICMEYRKHLVRWRRFVWVLRVVVCDVALLAQRVRGRKVRYIDMLWIARVHSTCQRCMYFLAR